MSSIELPNKSFLVMAGNIGSGKTTLTLKLAEELGWRPHFESVQDNPYLADFYQDMNRWSFPLQVYFLNHRFSTHRTIQSSPWSGIQDRSIYEDAHIFARALFEQGDMSERDYENYLNLYHSMVKFLTPPSLVIFLKRSVPKLVERVRLRGREFEENLSVDYLTTLNRYYDEWIESYDHGPSILLDTDELDFLNNKKDFQDLVDKIHTSLKHGTLQGENLEAAFSGALSI